MSIELISRPRRRVPKPVSHSWIRIERWLKKRAPMILASLREPAKKKDLQALEKALGSRLPSEFFWNAFPQWARAKLPKKFQGPK